MLFRRFGTALQPRHRYAVEADCSAHGIGARGERATLWGSGEADIHLGQVAVSPAPPRPVGDRQRRLDLDA